jgi:hypothetical protein
MRSPSLAHRVLYVALVLGTLSAGTLAWYRKAWAARAGARERILDKVSRRPVVFFGDSHIACAIDDEFDGRIANLGSANEFYLFTALKIRRVHPRVAVIGVWVHDFLPYFEDPLSRVALGHYDLWARDLSPEARADLMGRLTFEDEAYLFARSSIPFLGTQLSTDIPGPRQGLGGFMGYPSRPFVMSAAAIHRLEQMAEPTSHEPSSLQSRALDRILRQCHEDGTDVILLSTPVHGGLRRRLPEWMTRSYETILADMATRHTFRRWDESARSMEPDAYYDPDHLTASGARDFTRSLLERLEGEGLLPPR